MVPVRLHVRTLPQQIQSNRDSLFSKFDQERRTSPAELVRMVVLARLLLQELPQPKMSKFMLSLGILEHVEGRLCWKIVPMFKC